MKMNDKFIMYGLKLLPKKRLSRFIGSMARKSFSRHFIRLYMRLFSIDLSDVKKPIHEFEHLLDFFIRELKPGSRPIASDQNAIVSPVDGVISQFGTIRNGELIQAKGINYTLEELLDGNRAYIDQFNGGQFITIYLSPKDYHRIHAPVSGQVKQISYFPGALYPVNEAGVRLIPGLFAKNERLVTFIERESGPVALIKVGATNVGSIRLSFDDEIITNPAREKQKLDKLYQPPIPFAKGDEVGWFEFGSTIILLFRPNQMKWMNAIEEGKSVRMGECIAQSDISNS
ncbi:archaetidylserine decarboxylase [Polycladospora coralii]|uniref:archaetidylserine decarboxylase n=1 Tax=Polycladospora coralii TaxID=2771432 RepID=UPI00201BAAD1|nr:archaetidylserine decarboxylase [Polycladospora coralii]